ncbi:MAG: hypothetical protein M1825_001154 [Sarcosagium campestre]|nr:MAG: hypothetical protein M1825_001154 [Sarcosagium campestre]
MASHPQPSPPGGLHVAHHGPPQNHPPQMNGHGQPIINTQPKTNSQHLISINEAAWLQIGSLTELMGDLNGAMNAYEQAMRHNQWSIPAMTAISCILRTEEKFSKAVEYLTSILKIDGNNGDVWGSIGHCYLMMDDLQQAYSAYQQALYHLRDPKVGLTMSTSQETSLLTTLQEPKLWYGIGILYDRYGSLEHAEEAFSQVMRMQPDFEKANEIYFRLGIIYKQQQKYQQSLECFKYIVSDPPGPLTEKDIWFQIGHVHEQQKDYDSAQSAYRRVLDRDPNHAKVLQQLGWLHHQQSSSFTSQEDAINYLEKSVASDPTDAQSWYLLGRCYMSQQKYPKAYEAYQQAVYRDARNPTFWCSIGVLYYQINQYRDALDAYSRAIRLNPYISEVWYDLGTLYESCNNQINDALDAYQRAMELDPTNVHIKARLQLLRSGQATGLPNQNNAPLPQDVHPQAYQAAGVGGPPGPQWSAPPPGPQAGMAPRPAANGEWNRRLAEIQPPPHQASQQSQQGQQQPPPPQQQPQPPPPAQQQQHPYEQRETLPSALPRQPSPRQDHLRHYQEPGRHILGNNRRPMSPSPKVSHAVPHSYPQPGMPQPPPHHPQAGQSAPNRIANPNYGAPSAVLPPTNVPAMMPGQSGPMPPYGRGNSPPPEVRPIVDERPASPGSAYPHQSYQHHPNPSQSGGILSGAPPPVAAVAASEAAARERDEKPPTKRLRDWEDDANPSAKKPASEETRARLDDHHHHRSSPPDRRSSPHRRTSSEARRAEDQRRANENYHPSEAAHHPHSLPPMNHQQAPQHQQLPAMSDSGPPVPKEERREQLEPAARKVEVDEDYDDDGGAADDDKRAVLSGGRASQGGSSPQHVGLPPGPSNGMMNGQPTTVS